MDIGIADLYNQHYDVFPQFCGVQLANFVPNVYLNLPLNYPTLKEKYAS